MEISGSNDWISIFGLTGNENRRGNESVDWFLVQSRVFGWISLIIPESKRFLSLMYLPDGNDFIISKVNYAFSKVYEIFLFS